MVDGDVYKVTLEWQYSNLDVAVQNVLWFRQDGDNSDITIVPETQLGARLAAAMTGANDWDAEYRRWLSPNFRILNVRVQRVFPVVTGAYLTAVNVGGLGNIDAPAPPSAAAMLVRLASTLNTRRGRGRLYFGGFASRKNIIPFPFSAASEGYWSAGLMAALTSWFGSLKTAAQTAPGGECVFRVGVWSKAVAGPTPPYANGFSELVSWSAQAAIRCQRRREVGVGI